MLNQSQRNLCTGRWFRVTTLLATSALAHCAQDNRSAAKTKSPEAQDKQKISANSNSNTETQNSSNTSSDQSPGANHDSSGANGPASSLKYDSLIMNDGPAQYWRLDDKTGTAGSNQVSGGKAGEYLGAYTLNQSGPVAGAVAFNGHGIFNAQYTETLPKQGGLEFWCNPKSLSDNVALFTGGPVYLKTDATGKITLYNAQNFADSMTIINDGSFSLNKWHYLVITWDADQNKISAYFDGAMKASATLSSWPTQTGGITTGTVLAGPCSSESQCLISSRQYNLEGSFAEVAYYKKVLSAAQIQAHYAAATNTPGH